MKTLCRPDTPVTLAELKQVLPHKPLFGQLDDQTIGWQLSPEPFTLSLDQIAFIDTLGVCLHQFAKATQQLYRNSLKMPELAWVQHLFEQGKSDALITYSQMNRLKSQLQVVIRPDLIITEEGFALCEIDAVPGGIGFTAALHQAYEQLGFTLAGAEGGIPKAFLEMLLPLSPVTDPFIAVVVSDEAADYRLEMDWLVETIRQFYPRIAVVHPKSLGLERKRLGYYDEQEHFHPIDIVYRFFELFDLANIPNIELIQYAIKKGIAVCTPPFKPYLEEKMVLALLHYPYLADFWKEQLGQAHFDLMKKLVPESWILNPQPIPAHAQVVPALNFDGLALREFTQLENLTQKQRHLVVKPSGFSPEAWGSRGVSVGHDVSQADWQVVLSQAFESFGKTPYLLQRFENPIAAPYRYFDNQSAQIIETEGRTRLCPYYFVKDDQPYLAGILATTCPKNKKVIHGMRDGVMRPVCKASLEDHLTV